MIQKLKKINFRKGSGTSMGFICSLIVFLSFFVFFCNMFMTCLIKERIYDALLTIGHDIVACTNIDDAREMAAAEARFYLNGPGINTDDIYTDVQFDLTKGGEWEKGTYVYVTLSVQYLRMGFKMETREFTSLVMVERG